MMIIIVLFTFSCIALGVMTIYWAFARPASVVNAQLESADPSLALIENNPITQMTTRAAQPINRIVPISAVEAAKLQKKLLHAGYPSPDAAMAFRAIQLLLIVALPSVVLTICFLLDWALNSFLLWGVFAAAIGFYVPRLVLRSKISSRQQRITWGLADALDLMVIAVEAGLVHRPGVPGIAQVLVRRSLPSRGDSDRKIGWDPPIVMKARNLPDGNVEVRFDLKVNNPKLNHDKVVMIKLDALNGEEVVASGSARIKAPDNGEGQSDEKLKLVLPSAALVPTTKLRITMTTQDY